MFDLRPMEPGDAESVLGVMADAFDDLHPAERSDPATQAADRERGLVRIRHMMRTDPAGAWVGTGADGSVSGAALAIVREGIWGLSLLVVRREAQSRGLGSALLHRALATAGDARGGLIYASEDPRALRAYQRAGFALHPVLDAGGPVLRPPDPPAAVRQGAWPADRELIDAAGRAVRGAAHGDDIAALLAADNRLLVHEAGGFAVHFGGYLRLLAAHEDAVAAELLRAVLAALEPGAKAELLFLDAGQQWAIDVAVTAGLQLRPAGAICRRGEVGPMRPYLSRGTYL